ncbi:MAG: tetratricopeptide repeat protein [Alphaproteobacteria bacterium]|nr:tetratricopeptide repeat protein [Alphaproteobacteria bacterium]
MATPGFHAYLLGMNARMPYSLFAAIYGALLAWLLIYAPPAQADQRNPKLSPLFERLMNKELSAPEAREIEAQIWLLWQPSGSETTDLLLARADGLLREEDPESALSVLDEVVSLAPDYAEGWNKRATAHFLQDDYRAALNDVERTLRLEPRHFGAWSGLGTILLTMGEDARALRAYDHALQINPHLEEIAREAKRLELVVRGRGI